MIESFFILVLIGIGYISLVKIGTKLGQKLFKFHMFVHQLPIPIEDKYSFELEGTLFFIESKRLMTLPRKFRMNWDKKMVIVLYNGGSEVLDSQEKLDEFKSKVIHDDYYFCGFFRKYIQKS